MNPKPKGPVIVVLSDAHLGAGKSEFQLLYEFLREIPQRKPEHEVKALIILGDFFDICLENHKNLKRDFHYIFDELINLIRNKIPVIFSLGNHEISVTGNIEKNFIERKKGFINEFERKELLNQGNIGQYIEVSKDNSGININLYNSIKAFDKQDSDVTSIPINIKSKDEQDFDCLLTHGHQFEPRFALILAGRVWGALIRSKNTYIKKSVNLLWNTAIGGYRSIVGLTNIELTSIIKRVRINLSKKFIRKSIKKILKWEKWKDKNKNNPYIKRISKFIEKKGRFRKLIKDKFN